MRQYLVHGLLVLAALWHAGCDAAVLSAAQTRYTLGGADVAILKDAGGKLAVEDLQRPDLAAHFAPLTGALQLGYDREVVWLRLRLQRQQDAPPTWLLEFGNPYINDLRLYSRSATGFTVAQAGDQFAFADRAQKFRYPVFALAFPDTGLQTFYLRMDSDSSLAGALLVWQPDALRDSAQQEVFFLGVALGLICMSFLISLVHWLYSRERQLLLFAFLTAVAFLLAATGQGLVAPYFLPRQAWLADLLVPWALALATVATGVVFGHALGLRAVFPRLNRLLQLAYGLALLAPCTRALDQYNVWGGPMLQMLYLLVICCTGWASWMRWRAKGQSASYYFAAHLVLLVYVVAGRLLALGALPVNAFTQLNWIVALLTFLFLVHVGIFVESQSLKKERDAARVEAKAARMVVARERSLRQEQTAFFSFVAHELRSPLAAIMAGLKNLEDEWTGVRQPGPAPTRRIQAYAQRLGRLIDRHLSLQRLASADFSPRLAPVDPRQIAEECLDTVRALFAHHAFACDAADLPGSVSADPELLRMGLENLLINAAKYSPGNTAVDLEVFADTALHFRVSDRGPGIPAGQVGRLFSIFSQAPQAGAKGGFGIGLAMAWRVAHAHGGSLAYADRSGGGAVFTLSLPLAG